MIAELEKRFHKLEGRGEDHLARKLGMESKIHSETLRLQTLQEVQKLIQVTAKETQDGLKFHLTDLVQTALDSIFPEKYEFHVEFDMARGRTAANFYLVRDGRKLNPYDSNGGGLIDVVSFALRMAALSLGSSRRVLIQDEPFKFLSASLLPMARDMIKGLSKRMRLQIVMVTHDLVIQEAADRVFRVSQRNGVSKVKVLQESSYNG